MQCNIEFKYTTSIVMNSWLPVSSTHKEFVYCYKLEILDSNPNWGVIFSFNAELK